MFNSLVEAKRFMEEKHIQMVDFMMIDLNGRWRHLTIPADRFTEDTFKSGIGFDGSNYGFAQMCIRDRTLAGKMKLICPRKWMIFCRDTSTRKSAKCWEAF